MRAGALLVLVALALPSTASAEDRMAVEVGGGLGIPIGTYIDMAGTDSFHKVDNGLGGAINVALMFKGFTFRYASNWMSTSNGRLRLPDSIIQSVQQIGVTLPKETTYEPDGAIQLESAMIGYRFYLADGRFQPYIPLEVGAAFGSGGPLSRTTYGATAATGVGLDIQVWKYFWAGLAVRYEFYLTESDSDAAILGLLATQDVVESAMSLAHYISITANLQARF